MEGVSEDLVLERHSSRQYLKYIWNNLRPQIKLADLFKK